MQSIRLALFEPAVRTESAIAVSSSVCLKEKKKVYHLVLLVEGCQLGFLLLNVVTGACVNELGVVDIAAGTCADGFKGVIDVAVRACADRLGVVDVATRACVDESGVADGARGLRACADELGVVDDATMTGLGTSADELGVVDVVTAACADGLGVDDIAVGAGVVDVVIECSTMTLV